MTFELAHRRKFSGELGTIGLIVGPWKCYVLKTGIQYLPSKSCFSGKCLMFNVLMFNVSMF